MKRLRVVHVASEFAPLAKVGGLADAVAGLCGALVRHADVTAVLPLHPEARASGIPLAPQPLEPIRIPVGDETVSFRLWRAELGDPRRVFLLDAPRLFTEPGIYADPGRPGPGLRFGAFCRAVLALLPRVDLRPDVLHAHDHPTAFLPVLLKRGGIPGSFYDRTATVLTVHNAAHQGVADPVLLDDLRIDRAGFTPGGALEFWGQVNALKAGVLDAHAVTTVSPGYAAEIQGPLGFGLEGVFRERSPVGILNGIDTGLWNPADDPHLEAHYSARAPSRRTRNRNALVRRFDLDPARLVIGMVTRLADQKGLDLVRAGVDRLLERPVSLVVLGNGDPAYRDFLSGLAKNRPGRVAYQSEFDEPLAHRIYAGADLLLIPSRFEPCGLTQLLAMRYGAIPVVRRTGGLADTVRDADAEETGNGFVFDDYTPEAMLGAVDRAAAALADTGRRRRLQRLVMGADFSWERSARRYLEVYEEARSAPRVRET